MLCSISLFLDIGSFVGAVAERSVGGLLALAQPVIFGFVDREPDRLELDFQEYVVVRVIAEGLAPAPTAGAPVVDFSLFQANLEGLFRVVDTLFFLGTRCVDVGQAVFRDFWLFFDIFLGFGTVNPCLEIG